MVGRPRERRTVKSQAPIRSGSSRRLSLSSPSRWSRSTASRTAVSTAHPIHGWVQQVTCTPPLQQRGHGWMGDGGSVLQARGRPCQELRPITMHMGTCSGAEEGSEWPWDAPAVTIRPQDAGGGGTPVLCRRWRFRWVVGWRVSLGERAAHMLRSPRVLLCEGRKRHENPRNPTEFIQNQGRRLLSPKPVLVLSCRCVHFGFQCPSKNQPRRVRSRKSPSRTWSLPSVFF